MNDKMKKPLSVICAVCALIVCLVMVCFELIKGHVPALAWLAFSVFMFAYVALTRKKAKGPSEEAK